MDAARRIRDHYGTFLTVPDAAYLGHVEDVSMPCEPLDAPGIRAIVCRRGPPHESEDDVILAIRRQRGQT